MNLDNIRHFANRLSVSMRDEYSGRGWLEGHCPFAPWTHSSGGDSSMSFAISVSPEGRSHYTCLACGEHGSFPNLAYRLGALRKVDYVEIGHEIRKNELENKPIRKIPEWEQRTGASEDAIPYVDASIYPLLYYHPYLRKRNISVFTTQRLKLRYDFHSQRILFPVVDYRGILYGYTGRAVANVCTKDEPKVRDYFGLQKRRLFLGESLATTNRFRDKPLIIVEGLFDYARLVDAGFPNTLAILGTEITKEKLEKLVQFDRTVIWMLDNDQAGEKTLYGRIDALTGKRDIHTSALQHLRGKVVQRIVQYPEHINDPGECSNSLIRKLVYNSKIYY